MNKVKTAYGFGDKIFTANDLARSKGYRDNRAMLRRMLIKKGNAEVIAGLEQASGQPVPMQINASRMIANCEVCGEAMAINPGETFFCMGCLNYQNNNLARPIDFPSDLQDLCAVLLKRPAPRTRNWIPGETVQDLVAENEAEGVTA